VSSTITRSIVPMVAKGARGRAAPWRYLSTVYSKEDGVSKKWLIALGAIVVVAGVGMPFVFKATSGSPVASVVALCSRSSEVASIPSGENGDIVRAQAKWDLAAAAWVATRSGSGVLHTRAVSIEGALRVLLHTTKSAPGEVSSINRAIQSFLNYRNLSCGPSVLYPGPESRVLAVASTAEALVPKGGTLSARDLSQAIAITPQPTVGTHYTLYVINKTVTGGVLRSAVLGTTHTGGAVQKICVNFSGPGGSVVRVNECS
jgi:hypothetical protein